MTLPEGRGRRLALPAALLVAVLAPVSPLLLPSRTLVWANDSGILYEPTRGLVVESLREGRVPLWNPYVGTGAPLHAEGLHGVLSPVSLVLAWLDPSGRLEPLALAYVLVAAAGAFALAGAFGVGGAGRFAAGVCYGLSGWTLSMSSNTVFLAGAAGLPWVLHAMKAAGEGRRGGPAGSALAVGAAALTGEAQSLAVGLALGSLLAFQAGRWRGLLRAALGTSIGLLLGAAQLLPQAVHLMRTERWAYGARLGGEQWSLSPWRLPELFSPGFFWRFDVGSGDPFMLFASDSGALEGRMNPFTESIHFGAPAVLLAIAAASRRGVGRGLGLLAIVLLWLAMGHHLLASKVLGWVPIWGLFRYSEKLTGPLTLVLSVLVALEVDRLWRGERPRWLAPAAAGLALLVGGAALVASLGEDALVQALSELGLKPLVPPRLDPVEIVPDLAHTAVSRIVSGLGVAACGLALLAAVVAAHRRWPRRAAVGACALLWASAVAAVPHAIHFGPSSVLAAGPPMPTPGGPDRSHRLYTPYEPTRDAPDAGLDPYETHERASRLVAVANRNVALRLDSFGLYTGLLSTRYFNLRSSFGGDVQATLARRFAADLVATAAPRTEDEVEAYGAAVDGGRVVATDPAGAIETWQVPARPWVLFAGEVETVGSPREALAALRRLVPAGDPTVVVEAPDRLGSAPGRIVSVEKGMDWIRVEAEAAGDGTLVINDAWWPGWKATLDGAPVEVLPADVLVRAVRWPPGRHRLEMRYDPPEVRWGYALAALGLALLLVSRRLPRRPPPALS